MEILRSPERKKASSDGFHTLLPVAEAIQHPFVLMDPQQAKTTADSGGEESVEIQVSPVKLNTRRRLSRQSEPPTSTDKRSRNSTSNGNNNTTTSRYVKSEHIRPFLHTDHEDLHSTKKPRILIDLSEL